MAESTRAKRGGRAYRSIYDKETDVTLYLWDVADETRYHPKPDTVSSQDETTSTSTELYASTKRGTPYLKIDKNDENAAFDNNDDIYVSIYFLAELGRNILPCDGFVKDESRKQLRPEIEKEFIEEVRRLPDSFQFQTLQVPVRNEAGVLNWQKLDGGKAPDLKNLVKRLLKCSAWGGGKPVRHFDLKLGSPLKIKPLEMAKTLLQNHEPNGTDNVKTFFEKIITEVQKTGKHWKLEVYDGPGKTPNGYVELSRNPFDLYTTFISQEDWNKYMSGLSGTSNRIRNFVGEPTEIMDAIVDKNGLRDNAADHKLQGTNIDQDERSKGRLQDPENMKKRVDSLIMFPVNIDHDGAFTDMYMDLNSKKIEEAVGERDNERDQLQVMAGVSATKVAESFGWAGPLKGAAEWLHLAAFSWGGFGEAGQCETSQNIENLVFGTYETNSLMTRYEMAWQQLFMFEQSLAQKLAEDTTTDKATAKGSLEIFCNMPGDKVEYDYRDAKNYRIEEFTLDEDWFQAVKDKPPPLLTKKDIDKPVGKITGERVKNESSLQQNLLNISFWHKYIAYSVKYRVGIETHSRLLASPKYYHTAHFYPFRRPLFHKAEAAIDAELFEWMKKRAEESVAKTLITSAPSSNTQNRKSQAYKSIEECEYCPIDQSVSAGIANPVWCREIAKEDEARDKKRKLNRTDIEDEEESKEETERKNGIKKVKKPPTKQTAIDKHPVNLNGSNRKR